MKKKQRCLLKRFAALVAALMLCASLSVPAFASNNASSQKWVVVSESQMTNEQGTKSRYLELVPYENGSRYAAVVTTSYRSVVFDDGHENNIQLVLMDAVNYPDWWRSSIPLGANSYISFGAPTLREASFNGASESPSSFRVYLLNSSYALQASGSYSNSSYNSTSYPQFEITSSYPFYCAGGVSPVYNASGMGTNYFEPLSVYLPLGSTSTVCIQNYSQFAFSALMFGSSPRGWGSLGIYEMQPFSNLSSNELCLAVIPSNHTYYSANSYGYCSIAVPISFYVDANKLPAGLQVGDEFPANTDAFDKLRDELLEQFPEASDNIQNGKDTLQGWNDTETVDTDVASSVLSALNAMFQNLGSFLFIVSLMVFGAVVLRMFIRKAVDG